MRRIKLVLIVGAVMVALIVISASPASAQINDGGWRSILLSLDVGLVLVIERAMVVLVVALSVWVFYGDVYAMGWLGLGIARNPESLEDKDAKRGSILHTTRSLRMT